LNAVQGWAAALTPGLLAGAWLVQRWRQTEREKAIAFGIAGAPIEHDSERCSFDALSFL
jgi:hypothetical protein